MFKTHKNSNYGGTHHVLIPNYGKGGAYDRLYQKKLGTGIQSAVGTGIQSAAFQNKEEISGSAKPASGSLVTSSALAQQVTSAQENQQAEMRQIPSDLGLKYSLADFIAEAKKDAELNKGWTLFPPPSLVAQDSKYRVHIVFKNDFKRPLEKAQVWYSFYANDPLAQKYFYTVAGSLQWDSASYNKAVAERDLAAQGGALNTELMEEFANDMIDAAAEEAAAEAEANENAIAESFIAKNKYYLGAGVLLAGIIGYIVYQRQKSPLDRARSMVQRTL